MSGHNPSARWDPVEAAAFAYYCSRRLTLETTAELMHSKFGKTQHPRSFEDLFHHLMISPSYDPARTEWDLVKTNFVIQGCFPYQEDLTWFFATIELEADEEEQLDRRELARYKEARRIVTGQDGTPIYAHPTVEHAWRRTPSSSSADNRRASEDPEWQIAAQEMAGFATISSHTDVIPAPVHPPSSSLGPRRTRKRPAPRDRSESDASPERTGKVRRTWTNQDDHELATAWSKGKGWDEIEKIFNLAETARSRWTSIGWREEYQWAWEARSERIQSRTQGERFTEFEDQALAFWLSKGYSWEVIGKILNARGVKACRNRWHGGLKKLEKYAWVLPQRELVVAARGQIVEPTAYARPEGRDRRGQIPTGPRQPVSPSVRNNPFGAGSTADLQGALPATAPASGSFFSQQSNLGYQPQQHKSRQRPTDLGAPMQEDESQGREGPFRDEARLEMNSRLLGEEWAANPGSGPRRRHRDAGPAPRRESSRGPSNTQHHPLGSDVFQVSLPVQDFGWTPAETQRILHGMAKRLPVREMDREFRNRRPGEATAHWHKNLKTNPLYEWVVQGREKNKRKPITYVRGCFVPVIDDEIILLYGWALSWADINEERHEFPPGTIETHWRNTLQKDNKAAVDRRYAR